MQFISPSNTRENLIDFNKQLWQYINNSSKISQGIDLIVSQIKGKNQTNTTKKKLVLVLLFFAFRNILFNQLPQNYNQQQFKKLFKKIQNFMSQIQYQAFQKKIGTKISIQYFMQPVQSLFKNKSNNNKIRALYQNLSNSLYEGQNFNYKGPIMTDIIQLVYAMQHDIRKNSQSYNLDTQYFSSGGIDGLQFLVDGSSRSRLSNQQSFPKTFQLRQKLKQARRQQNIKEALKQDQQLQKIRQIQKQQQGQRKKRFRIMNPFNINQGQVFIQKKNFVQTIQNQQQSSDFVNNLIDMGYLPQKQSQQQRNIQLPQPVKINTRQRKFDLLSNPIRDPRKFRRMNFLKNIGMQNQQNMGTFNRYRKKKTYVQRLNQAHWSDQMDINNFIKTLLAQYTQVIIQNQQQTNKQYYQYMRYVYQRMSQLGFIQQQSNTIMYVIQNNNITSDIKLHPIFNFQYFLFCLSQYVAHLQRYSQYQGSMLRQDQQYYQFFVAIFFTLFNDYQKLYKPLKSYYNRMMQNNPDSFTIAYITYQSVIKQLITQRPGVVRLAANYMQIFNKNTIGLNWHQYVQQNFYDNMVIAQQGLDVAQFVYFHVILGVSYNIWGVKYNALLQHYTKIKFDYVLRNFWQKQLIRLDITYKTLTKQDYNLPSIWIKNFDLILIKKSIQNSLTQVQGIRQYLFALSLQGVADYVNTFQDFLSLINNKILGYAALDDGVFVDLTVSSGGVYVQTAGWKYFMPPVSTLFQLLGDNFNQFYDFGQTVFRQPKVGYSQQWQFYSHAHKNRIQCFNRFVQNYQLQQFNCIRQLQRYCSYLWDDFPKMQNIMQQKTIWQVLVPYMIQKKINIFSLVTPQRNYYDPSFRITFYISGCHMDLITNQLIQKNKKQSKQRIAFRYIQDFKPDRVTRRNRNFQKQWQAGLQAPYDPSLNYNKSMSFRNRVLSIDLQCLAQKHTTQTTVVLCCVGYPSSNNAYVQMSFHNDKQVRKCIYGNQQQVHQKHYQCSLRQQNCVYFFVRWLAQISQFYTPQQPLLIYYFYGHKYQLTYLLRALMKFFKRVNSWGPISQSKRIDVNNGAIQFVDVTLIIGGFSLLKSCKNYQTIVKKKQKQQIDIGLFQTWQKFQNNMQLIVDYCIQDCVCTLLLIQKFYCLFLQLFPQQIPMNQIKKKKTITSLAIFYWITVFHKKTIIWAQQGKIYDCMKYDPHLMNPQLYGNLRPNYAGGMVDVWQHVVKQQIFGYDANSFYPSRCQQPIPQHFVNKIQKVKQSLSQQESDLYLYRISYFRYSQQQIACCVPHKFNGTTIYPKFAFYGKQSKVCIWGLIVKDIIRTGGDCQLLQGWRFTQKSDSLQKCQQYLYQTRLIHILNNKEASQKTVKAIANNLTGVLARKDYKMGHSYYQSSYIQQNQNRKLWFGQNYIQQGQTIQANQAVLISIISYITSKCKKIVCQCARYIGPRNVIYTDTDSLYMTKQGHQMFKQWLKNSKPNYFSQQFRNKYPQLCKRGLGQWKLQVRAQNGGIFVGKKCYLLFTKKQTKIRWKGLPQKFITQQDVQMLVQIFLHDYPQFIKYPPGTKFQLCGQYGLFRVYMQVWRRQYGQKRGVTITQMYKKVCFIQYRLDQGEFLCTLPLALYDP